MMSRDVRTAWCSRAAKAAVLFAFATTLACDNPVTSALTGGNANFELSADFTENPCKLLPVERASEVLKKPASDLEGTNFMRSCTYNSDSSDAYVSIGDIYEHESVAEAKEWFASLKQKPTQEQVDEVTKQITEEVDKEIDKNDKMAKIADATDLGFNFKGIPPSEFKPVSGVGDEAMIDINYGTLIFRYGKYIFRVTAADRAEPEIQSEFHAGMDFAEITRVAEQARRAQMKRNLEFARANVDMFKSHGSHAAKLMIAQMTR